MPVDDLWYLTKRGPDNKKLPSKRHGEGKRWRVRFTDSAGVPRTRFFERKVDADLWDAGVRSGVIDATAANRAERSVSFMEYAERWRLAQEVGWAIGTRKRVESNLRCHLYPVFGDQPPRTITPTSVLEWLTLRLIDNTPPSSLKLYFELLDTVLTAAVVDKVTVENPCDGIRLAQILRGLNRTPKWVPTETEVLALFDTVPERYHGVLWLGAGQGLRIMEALGMEVGPRCVESEHGELHVVQQLGYSPKVYGGHYLSEPKSGSSGTVDLDPVVDAKLADHIARFPPADVELIDHTGSDPMKRVVPLMFTTVHGNPFTNRTWSREWIGWRDKAGWPKEHGGFHALRHFFATTLITNHAEPKDVQRLLRHKSLQLTLETYVHWWPRRERRRGLVGTLLQAASDRPRGG
jgi:integrase